MTTGRTSRRFAQRALGCWLLGEGASLAHYGYARRKARLAPAPACEVADEEYNNKFLALAHCDSRASSVSPAACASFIRHAFYGCPPEQLSRRTLREWLGRHLSGDVEAASRVLEETLGERAPAGEPATAQHALSRPVFAFVYGHGSIDALPKPLALRLALEFQRFCARRSLLQAGFREQHDAQLPVLRYLERLCPEDPAPPLLVLHGYGRGLASPLFAQLLPALTRRSIIIVDCPWLLVSRLPLSGNVAETPQINAVVSAIAQHLAESGQNKVDILSHSFGTALASALVRKLEKQSSHSGPLNGERRRLCAVRRAVLMDPMCFLPGITKQAQLLQRAPHDLVTELLQEANAGAPPTLREVVADFCFCPDPTAEPADEVAASLLRRHWVIFQTYFFLYFIFRDLVYSWVNVRLLHGPDYLDRGALRKFNQEGRLLTVLAETDTMIPASLLRAELAAEAPAACTGGVLWLPTVGHGACQHRGDVVARINGFLASEPLSMSD